MSDHIWSRYKRKKKSTHKKKKIQHQLHLYFKSKISGVKLKKIHYLVMSCHNVFSPNYNLIEIISSTCDFSLKIIKIMEIHLKESDVIYWNLIFFSFSLWRNYWNLKLTFRSSTVFSQKKFNCSSNSTNK